VDTVALLKDQPEENCHSLCVRARKQKQVGQQPAVREISVSWQFSLAGRRTSDRYYRYYQIYIIRLLICCCIVKCLSRMTPRFRTESDGRIDDSPTIRGRAAVLHRLDLECTTRALVFDSLNLIRLYAIHCFVSSTQAVIEEKAHFWSLWSGSSVKDVYI
jgi:hypothetical protein